LGRLRGSFDDRYKRVTVAFAKILNELNIKFAVSGNRGNVSMVIQRGRAGNEISISDAGDE
jgi:threonine synthase